MVSPNKFVLIYKGLKAYRLCFFNFTTTGTVEQLVNAARMVKPKVLFPYHYDQTDISGIPSVSNCDGIEVRIRHYE